MSKHAVLSSQLVTVFVDGQPVQVAANANLIQACEKAGKYVPHYCWHPALSVPGNCRLCLVKIEGSPRLVAGCHTGVKEGLKIFTLDKEVDDSRVGMMEFLLANHPLDCPVCDRGGECSLQRFSMDYGQGESRFYGNKKRRFNKPNADPLISIERNRCIHCTRCIRFCDELAGDAVLGMFGRGDGSYIGTFGDGPVSNIYSGNVIDMCPVGCLTNKPYRFKARAWELRQIPSTCTLCSTGCPVTYWMRSGLVYRTTPPAQKSDQFGKYTLDVDTVDFICNQGRFGNDFGRAGDRETRVLVRKDGKLAESTAGEAVKLVAAKLKEAANKGRVGVLVSPRLTNEELFLAQLVTRLGLQSNNIDWRLRLPHAEAAAAYTEAQAIADGSLDNIEQYDVTVLVSSALQQTMPISAMEIKEAARRGQTRLFVVASRPDKFLTDQARETVALPPDQLEAFVAGLGGDGLWPESAIEAGNLLRETIQGAKKVLIAYEPGMLSGHAAVSLVRAVRALKAKYGEKLHTLPLIRDTNATGAFFVGAQPDRLPSAPLLHGESRNRYTQEFGAGTPAGAGLSGPEILAKAAAGEIEALLILGAGDLLEHHPDAALVKRALDRVPFVAVSDLFATGASEKASVFLPAANFYERPGTILNVEGRVGLQSRAERPVGGARGDFEWLSDLAAALNVKLPAGTVSDIFKLLQKIGQTEGAIETGHPNTGSILARNPQGHTVFRGDERLERAVIRRVESPNGFKAAQPALGRPSQGLALVWDDILQGRDANGDRAEQRDILQAKPTAEVSASTLAELKLHDRDEAILTIEGTEHRVTVRLRPGLPAGLVWVARNVLLFRVSADLKTLPGVSLKSAPVALAQPVGAAR